MTNNRDFIDKLDVKMNVNHVFIYNLYDVFIMDIINVTAINSGTIGKTRNISSYCQIKTEK